MRGASILGFADWSSDIDLRRLEDGPSCTNEALCTPFTGVEGFDPGNRLYPDRSLW